MFVPVLERGADPEARLLFEDLAQAVFLPLQALRGHGEHAQPHAAGDVDAHGIRNDGVPRRQHTADRQPEAQVRIGHERATHRDGQAAREAQLFDGIVLDVIAPLTPGGGSHGLVVVGHVG